MMPLGEEAPLIMASLGKVGSNYGVSREADTKGV